MQCRSEERDSVVVSISFTASTSRNIHTAIKHTFTQKTWKWEEPKPNQTFRRSKSKFKGIALFCELHAMVHYGNRRLRACLLKCCSQRQSGNIRSSWLYFTKHNSSPLSSHASLVICKKLTHWKSNFHTEKRIKPTSYTRSKGT